jgi:hypothetical protein
MFYVLAKDLRATHAVLSRVPQTSSPWRHNRERSRSCDVADREGIGYSCGSQGYMRRSPSALGADRPAGSLTTEALRGVCEIIDRLGVVDHLTVMS